MVLKRLTEKGFGILFKDITAFGSMGAYGLILLFVLALQEYWLFLKLLLGFFITLIAVIIIRMLYFKQRPKKQEYQNIIEKLDASSFPSLHTARMFFFLPLFSYYFSNLHMTLFFIIFAVLVSYSRMYLKKHDWLDIIGGIGLGLVTFLLVNLL